MSNLTSTIRGYYPLNTFKTVRDLWHQMAAEIRDRMSYPKQNVRVVTNADSIWAYSGAGKFDPPVGALEQLPEFSLLQSDKFQALLTGSVVSPANLQQMAIEITFVAGEIDRFIEPLIPYLPSTVQLIAAIMNYVEILLLAFG